MVQVDVMARPIGERLKELRERANLSQEDLFARSGVKAATIRKIEQGHSDPKFTTLCALAKALGCTLADFQTVCDDEVKAAAAKPKKKKP